MDIAGGESHFLLVDVPLPTLLVSFTGEGKRIDKGLFEVKPRVIRINKANMPNVGNITSLWSDQTDPITAVLYS